MPRVVGGVANGSVGGADDPADLVDVGRAKNAPASEGESTANERARASGGESTANENRAESGGDAEEGAGGDGSEERGGKDRRVRENACARVSEDELTVNRCAESEGDAEGNTGSDRDEECGRKECGENDDSDFESSVSSDSDGEDDKNPTATNGLSAYEQLRADRIARNMAKLESLGLAVQLNSHQNSVSKKPKSKKKRISPYLSTPRNPNRYPKRSGKPQNYAAEKVTGTYQALHSPQKKKKKPDLFEGAHDNDCYICDNGGDLVCCDYCSKVYHLQCHIPPLLDVPRGEWMCCECKATQLIKKTRCGECDACLRTDCGRCIYCRDKSKFGGRNVLRKACIEKRCPFKRYAPPATVARKRIQRTQKKLVPLIAPKQTKGIQKKSVRSIAPKQTNGTQKKLVRSIAPKQTKGTQKKSVRSIAPKQTKGTQKKLVRSIAPKQTEGTQKRSVLFEAENDDDCYIYQNGGDLVCCDYCSKVYHLQCHIPPLSKVPDGEWTCCECKATIVEPNHSSGTNAPKTQNNKMQSRKIGYLPKSKAETIRQTPSIKQTKIYALSSIVKDPDTNTSNHGSVLSKCSRVLDLEVAHPIGQCSDKVENMSRPMKRFKFNNSVPMTQGCKTRSHYRHLEKSKADATDEYSNKKNKDDSESTTDGGGFSKGSRVLDLEVAPCSNSKKNRIDLDIIKHRCNPSKGSMVLDLEVAPPRLARKLCFTKEVDTSCPKGPSKSSSSVIQTTLSPCLVDRKCMIEGCDKFKQHGRMCVRHFKSVQGGKVQRNLQKSHARITRWTSRAKQIDEYSSKNKMNDIDIIEHRGNLSRGSKVFDLEVVLPILTHKVCSTEEVDLSCPKKISKSSSCLCLDQKCIINGCDKYKRHGRVCVRHFKSMIRDKH